MLDIHTHVFCWGENPQDGFLSEATRRRWLTDSDEAPAAAPTPAPAKPARKLGGTLFERMASATRPQAADDDEDKECEEWAYWNNNGSTEGCPYADDDDGHFERDDEPVLPADGRG